MKQLFIRASDGYLLSALFAKPVGDFAGTIVISSATGIRKEFYINFARYLVQQGYNVLLFDYRGIGESAPGKLRDMPDYMHEWGTLDMNAVLDYLVEERRLSGIIWVGHSVGAQLVGFVRKQEHISKVVSINSALGYWKYFPFPKRWMIWFLWYMAGPAMVKIYGYGKMSRIGWGEDLPPNMLMEWREWCLNKQYFSNSIRRILKSDKFFRFRVPMDVVYTSDDFIANDKTVPLMMGFFPNAPATLRKIQVQDFTRQKVGHAGIFRKRFEKELWPELVSIIESRSFSDPQQTSEHDDQTINNPVYDADNTPGCSLSERK